MSSLGTQSSWRHGWLPLRPTAAEATARCSEFEGKSLQAQAQRPVLRVSAGHELAAYWRRTPQCRRRKWPAQSGACCQLRMFPTQEQPLP